MTQEQSEVSGATARAGCDHKTSCKRQLGKKKKNSFVSWGREGVGTGCRLGITGLLRHGHRVAQRFPGSTSSSSPRAAPVPPRPILGLGMSQAAASLLG